jgi:hypothetical protein
LNPSFHLTTGTFNLVVKDPIALRLSGAFRYPESLRGSSNRPRSKLRDHRPTGLSASRDEPFEVSANWRFLSTSNWVIPVILLNPAIFPLTALSSLLPGGKRHARTERLNHQLKDRLRSLKPFRTLSSRMLPADPTLGNFGGFSSDDQAHNFDSKIVSSIRLQGLAAAHHLLFGHFP